MLEYFQLVNKTSCRCSKIRRSFTTHGPEELYEEYAYEEINGALIYKIACEIKGAAGPLNLDVNGWCRILTSSLI